MPVSDIKSKNENLISRHEKEKLLDQHGIVIWFTGLSGSGKSTLSCTLEKKFYENGYITEVLDGDKEREGINSDLGYSITERKENIRRIAEISKLFCNTGIVTISAFISPTNDIRNYARKIIGGRDFFEIFLCTPLEICEQRDTKGLYKKARKGEIEEFTGITALYEIPQNPDLIIDTSYRKIEDCTNEIYREVVKKITYF